MPVLRQAVRGDLSIRRFSASCFPVRQPASPATLRFGAGGATVLREPAMSRHYPPAHRLHALVGDAVLDLPARAVEKLEALLADHPVLACLCDPVARAAWLFAASNRRGNPTVEQRRLHGLAAILEILHAEHLSLHDGGSEPILGQELVEGLLVASRELVKPVDGRAGA